MVNIFGRWLWFKFDLETGSYKQAEGTTHVANKKKNLPPLQDHSSHNDQTNNEDDSQDHRSAAGTTVLTKLTTITLDTDTAWFPVLHSTLAMTITELRFTVLAIDRAHEHPVLRNAVFFIWTILAVDDSVTKLGAGDAAESIVARLRACRTLNVRDALNIINSNVASGTAACTASRIWQTQVITAPVFLRTQVRSWLQRQISI